MTSEEAAKHELREAARRCALTQDLLVSVCEELSGLAQDFNDYRLSDFERRASWLLEDFQFWTWKRSLKGGTDGGLRKVQERRREKS